MFVGSADSKDCLRFLGTSLRAWFSNQHFRSYASSYERSTADNRVPPWWLWGGWVKHVYFIYKKFIMCVSFKKNEDGIERMESCELVFTLERLFQNGIRHYVSEINKWMTFFHNRDSWYPKFSFLTSADYQLSSKLLNR